jgi:hypothetical protein
VCSSDFNMSSTDGVMNDGHKLNYYPNYEDLPHHKEKSGIGMKIHEFLSNGNAVTWAGRILGVAVIGAALIATGGLAGAGFGLVAGASTVASTIAGASSAVAGAAGLGTIGSTVATGAGLLGAAGIGGMVVNTIGSLFGRFADNRVIEDTREAGKIGAQNMGIAIPESTEDLNKQMEESLAPWKSMALYGTPSPMGTHGPPQLGTSTIVGISGSHGGTATTGSTETGTNVMDIYGSGGATGTGEGSTAKNEILDITQDPAFITWQKKNEETLAVMQRNVLQQSLNVSNFCNMGMFGTGAMSAMPGNISPYPQFGGYPNLQLTTPSGYPSTLANGFAGSMNTLTSITGTPNYTLPSTAANAGRQFLGTSFGASTFGG